jgi:hypothetical protein
MNYLSRCIEAEYAKQGILVQIVTPNQVETNLSKELHESIIAVTAPDFVRYALQTVGTESKTSAHPKHKFINGIFELADRWICERWFMKLKLSAMVSTVEKKKREAAAKRH